MTTITCDACGKKMKEDFIAPLPAISFVVRSESNEFHFRLTETDENVLRPHCQFNTTGVSICAECMVKALKAAVAELEAPIEN